MQKYLLYRIVIKCYIFYPIKNNNCLKQTSYVRFKFIFVDTYPRLGQINLKNCIFFVTFQNVFADFVRQTSVLQTAL